MQDKYWCAQCPWQDSCVGPEEYNQIVYDDNYRFDEEFEEDEYFEGELDEDFDGELDQEFEGFERTPRDVDRVIGLINRRSAAGINEIVRIGMDRKLLDYFIRTIVTYLDRNFNRYTGPMQRRIQEATRDIGREFQWAADIMRIYSVSPATQGRLFDEIVRVSLNNLRQPGPPTPPVPPRPPMPRED